MFKYACHKAGIDFDKVNAINVGGAADMDKAFRDGQGAYVQQQGPFPQQLVKDGVGHIVAQVGPQIGPVAFSSLAATRDWLEIASESTFNRISQSCEESPCSSPEVIEKRLVKVWTWLRKSR